MSIRQFHRVAVRRHVVCLVLKRTVVSVGQTIEIKADRLASVGNDINFVSFDSRRRTETHIFPVTHFAGSKLWDQKLPFEFPSIFVKRHQHASVTQLFRIAGGFIIRTRKYLSTSYRHVSVCL